ncbi:MAG: hypothetical protein K0R73_1459 [Candidatus Midichloriaceae bacterium]|nr:hypothetical protein [Candidatus Midichloriaceae bacterium]
MMRRIFKGDNAYVASFLNNIGIAYKKLGQYQQALQPHQESLAMMRRIFKGDHAYVADSLNSIGVIYERLGRYQEALQHYQESLATRKRIFKSDHAYVANSLQNLGLTYAILGQYQQALTHQEEGLAMRKRICKGDHADIAVSLINIGMTYEKLEQYEKALPYAEEAAAMFKKLLPPDHQYVVMSCKLLEIYEARIMPQRASLLSNNNVSLIRVPIGKQQVTMLLCFLTGKAFKAYLRNDNSYIVDAIFKIECISAPSDYVRSLSKKHNIEFSWEEVDAGGYNIILKGVNLEEAGKLVTQRYKEQQRLR